MTALLYQGCSYSTINSRGSRELTRDGTTHVTIIIPRDMVSLEERVQLVQEQLEKPR